MAKKKILVPLVLGTVLLTVGCGKSGDTMIETALNHMNDIESYTLIVDTEMTTQVEGQEKVTAHNVSEIKGTVKPKVALSMITTTKMQSGEATQEDEMGQYIFSEGDKVGYYEQSGDTWNKFLIDDIDMIGDSLKQPKNVAQSLIAYAEKYKMGEEVTIGDRTCYTVEAHLTEENFIESLEALNNLVELGLSDGATEVMEEAQSDIGGIVVKCFIDKETGELVKQTIDLGDMMELGVQEEIYAQGGTSIVSDIECIVEVTYQDINATSGVEGPTELIDATLVE